jgi:spermidine synthase
MPWNRPGGGDGPRALIVGYAGGTLHRVLRDTAPPGRAPRVTGVEIDAEVVALAREHLRLGELEDGRLDLRVGEDGRTALERMPRGEAFDLVFVDAYQRTQYVPFHLATVEFFRACVERLAPAGAVGINVNAPSGISGRLLRSLASTLAEALGKGGGVWIVPNPQYPGNATLWGTRSARAPRLPPEVPAALDVPAYALDRLLVRHVPGRDPGEVWTDDRAPVERLTDEAMRAEAPR